jgi:isoquinoline 1-oxidoreductase beta subunit
MTAPFKTPALSRRRFIVSAAAAGGGMMLGFHMPAALADAREGVVESKPWTTRTEGVEVNAWLTINPDGTTTIRIPHTEMGQGGMTSVALMVAEELNVPWESVRAVFADPNRHVRNGKEYTLMSTHGSQLVAQQHPHIMGAGASARERLKQAAAEAWGVERSTITAEQGRLSSGNHSGTYAEFAEAAAGVTLAEEPGLKPASEWWLLGKDIGRLDVPLKVTGAATFAMDVRLPDMAYAAVKSCPVPFGTLKSFDAEAIRGRPGIIDVIELRKVDGKRGTPDLQDAVAVVAESWYQARMALDLMPIEWDMGENGSVSYQDYLAQMKAALETDGDVTKEIGEDPRPAIAAAGETVTADYDRPYEAHMRMESINATVHVTPDRVDVWSPTQDQSVPVQLVADQLGRSTDDIYVHTIFLGGGFGGGGGGNSAVTRQAAELSRRIGRPVKVQWTREEDVTHGKHRPPSASRFTAVLGEDGLPTALHTRAAWVTMDGAGRVGPAGSADYVINNMPYVIPSRRHEAHTIKGHIPTATHRAPGANQNGFMTESFVDEMAIAGGWDPLDWRLKMTEGMDDWQLVLTTLKEKSGYRTDLPRGEGMGVAVVACHGTIAGASAHVSVSRRGQLFIEEIHIVLDSGHVINTLSAAEQAEGSVCYELSHAMAGGLDIRNGQVMNTNFDRYAVLRMHEMPQVHVHFAMTGGTKWGGLGEPAGPPTPPAVANAIFQATGVRIRSTPFNAHDLRWS